MSSRQTPSEGHPMYRPSQFMVNWVVNPVYFVKAPRSIIVIVRRAALLEAREQVSSG